MATHRRVESSPRGNGHRLPSPSGKSARQHSVLPKTWFESVSKKVNLQCGEVYFKAALPERQAEGLLATFIDHLDRISRMRVPNQNFANEGAQSKGSTVSHDDTVPKGPRSARR